MQERAQNITFHSEKICCVSVHRCTGALKPFHNRHKLNPVVWPMCNHDPLHSNSVAGTMLGEGGYNTSQAHDA